MSDQTNVVCPSIDNINDDTLAYQGFGVDSISVGKFTWDLTFNWMPLPEYSKKNRSSKVAPVPLVGFLTNFCLTSSENLIPLALTFAIDSFLV